MPKTTQIQVRLSEEEKARLKAIAQGKGISVTELLVSGALALVDKAEKLSDQADKETVPIVTTSPDLLALTKKIYNTEGVPMRVARQRAIERLQDA